MTDRPTIHLLVALAWHALRAMLNVLSNWHDSRALPFVDWWTHAFDREHAARMRDHETRLARIEGQS